MKLEVLLYLNINKIAFSVNEKYKYGVVVFFGVGLFFFFLGSHQFLLALLDLNDYDIM